MLQFEAGENETKIRAENIMPKENLEIRIALRKGLKAKSLRLLKSSYKDITKALWKLSLNVCWEQCKLHI